MVGALFVVVVVVSTLPIEAIQLPILRFLEGYWPSCLEGWHNHRVKNVAARLEQNQTRFDQLAPKYESGELTNSERRDYERIEASTTSYPVDQARLMPMRLGNILRAAEEYPENTFGLVASIVWARLWMVMPGDAREDVARARAALDETVRLLIWSAAVLIWVIPAGKAWGLGHAGALALVSFAGVWASYSLSVNRAEIYGELIRAAFDIHHRTLFEKFGWPKDALTVPVTPQVGKDFMLLVRRAQRPEAWDSQPHPTVPELAVGTAALSKEGAQTT